MAHAFDSDIVRESLQADIPVRSIEVLGIKLTPLDAGQLVEVIAESIAVGRQAIVAAQNLHGVYVMQRDPAFGSLHRLPNTIVHIDGMPLLVLARLFGHKLRSDQRVTMLDWMWCLLQKAATNGWRVFYLGGEQPMMEKVRDVVSRQLPALSFACHHGFFDHSVDSDDNKAVLATINTFMPNLVLVGMGMGPQESWIVENRLELMPATVCVVGGCFEYIVGDAATPPRWSGKLGLEWFFRLLDKPERFWFRYLIEPFCIIIYALWHFVTERKVNGPEV